MATMKAPSGLTGLRWLACLCIVLYHLNQQRSVVGLSAIDWASYQFVQTFAVAVSFFFVLGWAMRSVPYWRSIMAGESIPDVKDSLVERFFRIAPAYYLALLGSFAVVLLMQGGMENALVRLLWGLTFLSWMHPATFFPVDLNGPLWYIAYDMMGGFFVIFLMTILAKIPKKLVFPGILFVAVCLVSLHFAFVSIPFPRGEGVVYEWFPTYNPFLFGLHFLVGILVGYGYGKRELENSDASAWNDLFAFASFAALGLFLAFASTASDFAYSWPTGPYRFPTAALLIAFWIYFLPYSVRVGKWLDNAFFRFVAKISYSTYLWHAIVIVILRRYAFDAPDLRMGEWWLLALSSFVLTFLVANLSYRFVESVDWKKRMLW